MTHDALEFYETPQAFSRYLFLAMKQLQLPICGTVFEPCVGSNAIPRAYATLADVMRPPSAIDRWITNDIDRQWGNAQQYSDATRPECWRAAAPPETESRIEWTVSNPPFTPALAIIDQALQHSQVGVAMHLRASIHEVLKTGIRRTWMATHTPTGLLWLPRFAYQRSKAKGIWSTDSVCACWVIWMKDPTVPQFIRYAPEWVLDELEHETPVYREHMDVLNGLSGSEKDRQRQWQYRTEVAVA